MDFLSVLNSSQRQAAVSTEGYIRVVAGAGTGKTRSLTCRYAYLVDELGIPASNILCITFTNKAAAEMKRRIKNMLGGNCDTSFVATLHAFCTRILREDISKLFYPESFTVLDNADQKKLLEEVYDELGVKMDTASFKFMLDQIRYYKNLITYVSYLSDPSFDFDTLTSDKTSDEIIFRYIKKQRKYFALDFFDLINFTIYLFDSFPDVLEKWQRRLCYIMVDEFQDITAKEFKQIRRLSELNRNLFVVGDPDQNIYEWRGANMDVIVKFEEWLNNPCFPNQFGAKAQTIIMNENYRSAAPILIAANTLIAKNSNRVEKELIPALEIKEPVVKWLHCKNEGEELSRIIEAIKDYTESGGEYSDIALLYRSQFAARFIEEGFIRENVPYTVFGGVGFYERAEIKDALAYLRIIVNSADELALKRILNIPRRRLGKAKLDIISAYADEKKLTLYDALKVLSDTDALKGSGAKKLVGTIEALRAEAGNLTVSDLLKRVMCDTGYELYIRESGDIERLDNITELMRGITAYEGEYGETLTAVDYLSHASLMREEDTESEGQRVRLMTIHTSKGLEFGCVIMVGMTEGVFPSARSLEERKGAALEEERRLCFVGMTRAKRRLYMTESEGYGVKGYSKTPSRFLYDLGESIERVGRVPRELEAEREIQVKEFDRLTQETYKIGDQMRHKAFGEGVIESVDEKTRTYYIRFVNGVKPISFNYAGLSHIF